MKTAKHTLALILLMGLLFTGCETPESDVKNPNQEENIGGSDDNTEDNTGNDDGGSTEDDGKEEQDNSWIDNPTPMPEATYVLNSRLNTESLVTYKDGKRNDYLSFYEATTDYTVYFDIYTDESNTTLPTGRYLLADNFDNAIYREWSYFSPYTDSELIRFTDGWLEVIADEEHSSGYLYYKIRGYFVMESGESISVEWEGTIIEKMNPFE